MNKDDVIRYWVESAEHDYPVMESLFDAGHYAWALFIGHLVVEKLLKAHHVKHNPAPCPYTHNLLKLAEGAGLDLNEDARNFLIEMNAFNINSRYPDLKHRFYKVATLDFTQDYIIKIREFRQWILQQNIN